MHISKEIKAALTAVLCCFILLFSWNASWSQHGDSHAGHDHSGHDHTTHPGEGHQSHGDHHGNGHGHAEGCHKHEFNAGETAIHHISDANIFSIGPWSIPLPCMLYVKGEGIKVFSSGRFDIGHHGNGHKAIDGWVLHGGSVKRFVDEGMRSGSHNVSCFVTKHKVVDGAEKTAYAAVINGKDYEIEGKSTLDGGLFGGGITSFYDFSLTKNVVSMILVFIFLAWMFLKLAKAYSNREGKAPSGLQSLIEPVFTFIQDEVSKPILGHKWEKYQPFLMALFFFILGLNLFGQIPFLGNANVTGNIAVTVALALFTFFIVNLSGNGSYWQHIFWMPGVPAFVKVILTPVEILGVFLKPMTLFIRLFGNIAAGHMVIIIFVSLIFIFGKSFGGVGTGVGIALSVPLTIFMMALELLVAFLQAFVFTILSAVYIGAAIEEHH